MNVQSIHETTPSTLHLTTTEVAAQLGLAPKTVANWRTASPPRGPDFMRLAGNTIRYRQTAVNEFIASCEQKVG